MTQCLRNTSTTSLTMLQRLQTLKGDLELVGAAERRGVVENVNVE